MSIDLMDAMDRMDVVDEAASRWRAKSSNSSPRLSA